MAQLQLLNVQVLENTTYPKKDKETRKPTGEMGCRTTIAWLGGKITLFDDKVYEQASAIPEGANCGLVGEPRTDQFNNLCGFNNVTIQQMKAAA